VVQARPVCGALPVMSAIPASVSLRERGDTLGLDKHLVARIVRSN